RELLEVAGKKEVAMMFPLVFLLLPVTILFAVFPGLFVLQLGF
ncbi:MAG TPA: pilus assembly protein, partial [Terrimesophilobacter sp.]|nr:pilus assembly protein [Terrimesophilobacter sp.]